MCMHVCGVHACVCVCVVCTHVWCACMFVCVRLHLSVEHTFSGVYVPSYLLARHVRVTICDLDLCCCVHTTTFLELNFRAICLLLLIHTLPAPCPLHLTALHSRQCGAVLRSGHTQCGTERGRAVNIGHLFH